MNMIMKAIVAVDDGWAIGKDNNLLYHIKDDLKRFKELTTNNIVVMGRKTFESLPNKKPLPNRTNIILTTDINYQVDFENVEVVNNIYDLISKLTIIKKEDQNVFVIGGESIYNLLLPMCDEVYVTKIYDDSKQGDKFFPNLDKDYRWTNENEISTIRWDKEQNLYYEFKKYYNNTLKKK